jgi:hypothetical protein
VEIPPGIEQAVDDAVARQLETELGRRGLLLAADELAVAEAEAAQRGTHLLTGVIHRCYPISRQSGVALEFESNSVVARIQAALAFGGATARLLLPGRPDSDPPAESVELICAMFNLGIGLIDGLSDQDAETGEALLELVQRQDLAEAAEVPRDRRWLRAAVPPVLAGDPTVAFTVEIVETFFETLHALYPADRWLQLRRVVGRQLEAALEAERRSVARSASQTTRERLIECSRLTSVLPFQVIETLAGGSAPVEPTVGTQLGEAMWRIDDLVDLSDDARSASLNAILLGAASGTSARPGERDLVAALDRLLESGEIARAAAEAAERLLAGLQPVDDRPRTVPFLSFVQRYAGIAPRQAS